MSPATANCKEMGKLKFLGILDPFNKIIHIYTEGKHYQRQADNYNKRLFFLNIFVLIKICWFSLCIYKKDLKI